MASNLSAKGGLVFKMLFLATCHAGAPLAARPPANSELRCHFRDGSMQDPSCAEDDRTFEVKDFAPATPRTELLNSQVITVLGARGVPARVFTELAREHIQQLVQETLEGTSPQHGLPGFREAADGNLDTTRYMKPKETWGRMACKILCGDFYQLPPVPATSSNDRIFRLCAIQRCGAKLGHARQNLALRERHLNERLLADGRPASQSTSPADIGPARGRSRRRRHQRIGMRARRCSPGRCVAQDVWPITSPQP